MDAVYRPAVSTDARKNHNPDDAPPIRCLAGEPLTHLTWAPAAAATGLVTKDEAD
jgi:hypothetical protein